MDKKKIKPNSSNQLLSISPPTSSLIVHKHIVVMLDTFSTFNFGVFQ